MFRYVDYSKNVLQIENQYKIDVVVSYPARNSSTHVEALIEPFQ
jgi:hypothetical protein